MSNINISPAIPNVFKDYKDNESIFYTFSEYTNDLVNNINGGGNDAVPCSFICCKVDRDVKSDLDTHTLYSAIQSYEEHAAEARGKYLGGNSEEYKGTLLGLLSDIVQFEVAVKGDIDIFCDDTIGGERYDEFVCYLAPDSTSNDIEFNAIIVLYRIGDSNVEIPLGMYIASSPVFKKASDSDIYDQGTSYALRVCMRFASTINGTNLIVKEVNPAEITSEYHTLTSVISRLNDTMDKYDTMTAAFNNYANIVRENQTAAIMVGYSMRWLGFVDGSNDFVDQKQIVNDINGYMNP